MMIFSCIKNSLIYTLVLLCGYSSVAIAGSTVRGNANNLYANCDFSMVLARGSSISRIDGAKKGGDGEGFCAFRLQVRSKSSLAKRYAEDYKTSVFVSRFSESSDDVGDSNFEKINKAWKFNGIAYTNSPRIRDSKVLDLSANGELILVGSCTEIGGRQNDPHVVVDVARVIRKTATYFVSLDLIFHGESKAERIKIINNATDLVKSIGVK